MLNNNEEIKDFVNKAVDTMYNQKNVEKIRQYYHPGYTLFKMRNNTLVTMPLHNRCSFNIEKSETKDENSEKVTIRFKSVSMYETAATVCFDYFKGDRQTCVDFMSLYKFDKGWRIVSQTTHHLGD